MPTYKYRAISIASGRNEAGQIEAPDRGAAIFELRSKGFLTIEADEAKAISIGWLRFSPTRRSKVRPRQLGFALQELAMLLEAGLQLERALEMISTGSEETARSLGPTLARILARIRQGISLSEAVAEHPSVFPPSIATLIEAGEAGGTLGPSLVRAADLLLKSAAMRETIFSALLYPMILLVAAGLSLTVILTVVLPAFKPLFEEAGASLPLPTRIVMALGDAVRDDWFPALVLACAAVAAFRLGLRRPQFRLAVDQRLLRLPIFGKVIAKVEIARFARTLGSLANNGIPVPRALGIARRGFANAAFSTAVEHVAESVKKGEGLAGPLEATRLFPQSSLHLIRVGEETARLGEMLERLAGILDQEVQRHIQRALALLVPVVTLGLGVIIAGIIASVLVALLSLNELAQ